MKYIYNLFAAKIRRELVDELMSAVPAKVRNPALRVMADNKYKMERMCMFMAHELHRKMVQDRKHSELYEGQLLQIKLFLAMIQTAEQEEKKTVTQKEDDVLEKARKGVSDFRALINNKTS